MKFTILTSFFLFIHLHFINAQVITKPSVDSKSHPTLSVVKIEFKENETVFYMSIVNRIKEGGWFCVDKNVKITSADLKNDIKMLRSENIPNCPTTHQFTKINESKNFKLFFPPIPPNIKEIDLIEDCSDNCFFIKGVVLDQVLNDEIKTFDKGFSLYSKNDFRGSLQYFNQIRDNSVFKERKHYGYSIYIIPVIYHKLGEDEAAKRAFQKLKDQEFKDKKYFVEQIKKIDFFKNL
ncbi:MAG: tetratricopeptide repeat protein [Deltaproteobacteria bacterium]